MTARARFGTFYAYSPFLCADIASRRLAAEQEDIVYWMLLPPGVNAERHLEPGCGP
jgi:hypothetical protein